MKYINQLNIVIVLAATAIVLYSFTETYWNGGEPPPLQIEQVAAPSPRPDSRRLAPTPNSPRSGGTSVDPGTGLPAPRGDESGSAVFPSGDRQPGPTSSGSPDRIQQSPRIFSVPSESAPSENRPMPQWNPDASPASGAESDPGDGTAIRPRGPRRPPSGQTIFPGAEDQKRQESQDPSPPPVRSSMPNRPR